MAELWRSCASSSGLAAKPSVATTREPWEAEAQYLASGVASKELEVLSRSRARGALVHVAACTSTCRVARFRVHQGPWFYEKTNIPVFTFLSRDLDFRTRLNQTARAVRRSFVRRVLFRDQFSFVCSPSASFLSSPFVAFPAPFSPQPPHDLSSHPVPAPAPSPSRSSSVVWPTNRPHGPPRSTQACLKLPTRRLG